MGCMGRPSPVGIPLLSLDESHPSTGKMRADGRYARWLASKIPKLEELLHRKRVESGLEHDYGFP